MDRVHFRCNICSLNFNSLPEKVIHDSSADHLAMMNFSLAIARPLNPNIGSPPQTGTNLYQHMTYHNQGGVPYNVLPPTISSQTHNYYDQSYQHRWHGGTRNKHGHARNNNTRKSTSSDIDSTSRPSSKSKNSDSRRNSTNGTKPTDTSSRNSDTSYSSRPNTPSSNTSTPRPSILKSKPTQSNQNTSNKAPITNNQNHESFNSSNDQAVDVRKKKKRFRKGRKRNIIKGDVVMEPPSKSGGRNMKNNERVLPKHVKFITEPDEQQTPSLVDQSVQATPPSNTTPQGQISHSSSVQKCGSSSETFADHTRRHHRFKNQGSTTPGYSENKLSSSVKNSNHDNQVPTEMSSMHSLMSSKTTINKDSNQEDTTLMNGSFQSRKRKGETMDRDNSVMKKSRVVPQGEASNTNQSNQLGSTPVMSRIGNMMNTVKLHLKKEQLSDTNDKDTDESPSISSILPKPVALSPCSTCCFKQRGGLLCNKQILDGERLCSEHRFVAERLKEELGLSPVKSGISPLKAHIGGSSLPLSSKVATQKQNIYSTPKLRLDEQLPNVTNRVLKTAQDSPGSSIATPTLPLSSPVKSSTHIVHQTTPTPPISPTIPVIKMPEIVRSAKTETVPERLYISLSSDSDGEDQHAPKSTTESQPPPPIDNQPPLTTEDQPPDTVKADQLPPNIANLLQDQPAPPTTEDQLPPNIENQPPPTTELPSIGDQPPPSTEDQSSPKDYLPPITEADQLPPTLPTSDDTPSQSPSTHSVAADAVATTILDLESMETEELHPLLALPTSVTPSKLTQQLSELNKKEDKVQTALVKSNAGLSEVLKQIEKYQTKLKTLELVKDNLMKKCDELTREYQGILGLKQTLLFTECVPKFTAIVKKSKKETAEGNMTESGYHTTSEMEISHFHSSFPENISQETPTALETSNREDPTSSTRVSMEIDSGNNSIITSSIVESSNSILKRKQLPDSDGYEDYRKRRKADLEDDDKRSKYNGNEIKQNENESKHESMCENETRSDGNEARSDRNEAIFDGNEARSDGNEARSDENEARSDGNEARFDGNEARSDGNEARSDGNEARSDGNEARSDGNEARFDGNEARSDGNEARSDKNEARSGGNEPRSDVNEFMNDENESMQNKNESSLNSENNSSGIGSMCVGNEYGSGDDVRQSKENETESMHDDGKHDNRLIIEHHDVGSETNCESLAKQDENESSDLKGSKNESKHDENESIHDLNVVPCDIIEHRDNDIKSMNDSTCDVSELSRETKVIGSGQCDTDDAVSDGVHDDGQNKSIVAERQMKSDKGGNPSLQSNTSLETNDLLAVVPAGLKGDVTHDSMSSVDDEFFITRTEDISMEVESLNDVPPVFEHFSNSVLAVKIIYESLYACSSGGIIKSFNLKTGEKLDEFTPHSKAVTCLDYYQKEKTRFVLSGSSDKLVLMTNIKTKKVIARFKCTSRIMHLMVHESLLYIAQYSGVVAIINLKTKKLIDKHKCHKNDKAITSIVLHDPYLFTASFDNTIICWDIKGKFKKMHTITTFTDAVLCMKIHDCKLFCGSADKSVQVYCIKTWMLLHDLRCHAGAVPALEIMGKVLITICFDKLIRCFDLDTFEIIQVYGGHNDMIFSLVAHSGMIYTGDKDGTVKAVALDLIHSHKCMWKDCQLPFGVLKHLKDHVKSHCSNNNDQHLCLWEGCTLQEKLDNKTLLSHIEAVHLIITV